MYFTFSCSICLTSLLCMNKFFSYEHFWAAITACMLSWKYWVNLWSVAKQVLSRILRALKDVKGTSYIVCTWMEQVTYSVREWNKRYSMRVYGTSCIVCTWMWTKKVPKLCTEQVPYFACARNNVSLGILNMLLVGRLSVDPEWW